MGNFCFANHLSGKGQPSLKISICCHGILPGLEQEQLVTEKYVTNLILQEIQSA